MKDLQDVDIPNPAVKYIYNQIKYGILAVLAVSLIKLSEVNVFRMNKKRSAEDRIQFSITYSWLAVDIDISVISEIHYKVVFKVCRMQKRNENLIYC